VSETTELLTRLVEQGAAREERFIQAIEKLGTALPPQDHNTVVTARLRMDRGLDRPVAPLHTTGFEGSITDPDTAAPIRVTGRATFQQTRTALPGPDGAGKGPLIWKCIELPEDNLGAEDGPVRKVFDPEFSAKNRDDLARAQEDPDTAAHLRAKHAKEFRIAVFLRGRRPLHNLLLGKSAEQVASIVTLADPPPALGDQTPEFLPVAEALTADPLRAILRG